MSASDGLIVFAGRTFIVSSIYSRRRPYHRLWLLAAELLSSRSSTKSPGGSCLETGYFHSRPRCSSKEISNVLMKSSRGIRNASSSFVRSHLRLRALEFPYSSDVAASIALCSPMLPLSVRAMNTQLVHLYFLLTGPPSQRQKDLTLPAARLVFETLAENPKASNCPRSVVCESLLAIWHWASFGEVRLFLFRSQERFPGMARLLLFAASKQALSSMYDPEHILHLFQLAQDDVGSHPKSALLTAVVHLLLAFEPGHEDAGERLQITSWLVQREPDAPREARDALLRGFCANGMMPGTQTPRPRLTPPQTISIWRSPSSGGSRTHGGSRASAR